MSRWCCSATPCSVAPCSTAVKEEEKDARVARHPLSHSQSHSHSHHGSDTGSNAGSGAKYTRRRSKSLPRWRRLCTKPTCVKNVCSHSAEDDACKLSRTRARRNMRSTMNQVVPIDAVTSAANTTNEITIKGRANSRDGESKDDEDLNRAKHYEVWSNVDDASNENGILDTCACKSLLPSSRKLHNYDTAQSLMRAQQEWSNDDDTYMDGANCKSELNLPPLTLYQKSDFQGHALHVYDEGHWFLWAEQRGVSSLDESTLRAPKIVYFNSVQVRKRQRAPMQTIGNYSETLNAVEKTCVYFVAHFCEWDRTFYLPLVLDGDEPDLDAHVQTKVTYSAVFNPRGSGAYTHWGEHHIRYYVAWMRHIV